MGHWWWNRQGWVFFNAWDHFRDLYRVWLPAHRSSLHALANRPIDR